MVLNTQVNVENKTDVLLGCMVHSLGPLSSIELVALCVLTSTCLVNNPPLVLLDAIIHG